ncbi:hypothetical protein MVEN_02201500 [Mycena venus]|uniref:Kinesin light chain n=1 Tax=Mycena venus TaxID=2733690 RepID=A0A8H6X7I9_9AGAR|nr:hypothetical protein MVEN_02201500 [Mycena venus]
MQTKWALVVNAFLSPSPGRTLDRVYSSLGSALEKQANRAAYTLGLGPHVVAQKIQTYFENREERVRQLELLRTVASPKLEKQCSRLMKYTLPVQCQAFKNVIELTTLFPGFRVLFLRTKHLDNIRSMDAIYALWGRSTESPDEEFTFWQTLAATCLMETTLSAVLEETSVLDLANCQHHGLSVIERLLIERDCSGASKYSNALCIRYLGGILDLPSFWLDMGSIHAHVAKKLCCEMVRVLTDMGVDIPTLGPLDESESAVDYDGVDFLAARILNGFSSWFSKMDQEDWIMQPWYESFTGFVDLLRMPRAAELLPQSSECATRTFKDILPTIHYDTELHVMVDGQNTIPESPDTPHNTQLADLRCKNNSILSINSDTSQQDCRQSIECLDDAQSQHSDRDSEELSAQNVGMPSSTSEDTEYELMNSITSQMDDTVSDCSSDLDFDPGLDTGYGSNAYGNKSVSSLTDESWNLGNAGIHTIAWGRSFPTSAPHPALEAWRKAAGEWKIILLQRERDLGNDHPDTLEAMKILADAHYELGDFSSAGDLEVVLLEKQRILLGENHADTLQAMSNLASTYTHLGQYKKAEDLAAVALGKCRQLLGDNNPNTLWTMGNLAWTLQLQGQLTKAESLQVELLEKATEVLGPDHLDTLRTMGNLASTYNDQGQYKKAVELEAAVLDVRTRILGEDHPDTLRAMGAVAMSYRKQGQYKEAEELQREVLKKRQQILGEDHPVTLRTMSNLALTYLQLGWLGAAEALGAVALEKQRKFLGEDHPDTVYTMGDLALTYLNQGQFECAEELYVTALEKWRRIFGDDHPNVIFAMRHLAFMYRRLGKLQNAEELEALSEQV